MTNTMPKVVILGAGFGGLFTARALMDSPVDILLIDRNNYHTFTPLIYQVATCGLDVDDVSYPVRKIFSDKPNVNFLLGEVIDIHQDRPQVSVQTADGILPIAYDYLIVAVGSVTNTFGNTQIDHYGFGLKTVEDAVRLRSHILGLLERADWQPDPVKKQAMTTFVVVGGGPTGLETAGALYELYQTVLQREYHTLKGIPPRVILIEATDTVLRPYPAALQVSAIHQLQQMGIDVRLSQKLVGITPETITLDNGEVIPTHTLVWAAGVKGSGLAAKLGVELLAGGRIPVEPTLEVIGRPNIYAVGDITYLKDPSGMAYPQVIPVAQQQAKRAAQNILNQIQGQPQAAFSYFDRGSMATIGRTRAVAWLFNRVEVSGFIAWMAWLGLHLVTLLGFRNQISVFLNWVWNYVAFPLRGGYYHRTLISTREQADSEPDAVS